MDIEPVENRETRGEWLRTKTSDDSRAIFYIHGGGFVSCSAKTHRPITGALARKTGFPVFSTNYRLAPEHRFPAAIEDVTKSYLWLLEQPNQDNIAIGGDSAGGGLVLSLLLDIREKGLPMPKCAVCFSPWTDLTASGNSFHTNADKDAMFYQENMEEFATAYVSDVPTSDWRVSPLFADYHGLPPIMFQAGSTEMLLDDSRRIHEQITNIGGVSELKVFENVPHGWQMLYGFVPEADKSLSLAAEFIKRNCKKAFRNS